MRPLKDFPHAHLERAGIQVMIVNAHFIKSVSVFKLSEAVWAPPWHASHPVNPGKSRVFAISGVMAPCTLWAAWMLRLSLRGEM